jgi:hypothetical protein
LEDVVDRPDDLDVKSTEILEALRHAQHDGPAYWPAVHAVGALVAELVRLRGERDAVIAFEGGKRRSEEEK